MEVIEAIKGRRSIRRYKPDPVSDADLEAILEAARWAPSWANSQCWQFVVVQDGETKRKLQQTLSPGNQARLSLEDVPIVIVACAERGKSGYKDGRAATDKGDWFMFDVALAVQNMTLAAYSLGLGTVHVGLFDSRQVVRILGVPTDIAVVELILLGHPDEQPDARPRKALSDFVHYDKYGNKWTRSGV